MHQRLRMKSTVTSSLGLHLQGVRLKRGITTVFDGLQLRLTEQRIGLIGDNGAGKTSLFRLLCAPSAGTASRSGGFDVSKPR